MGAALLSGLSLLLGGIGCPCGGAFDPAGTALLGGVLGANLIGREERPSTATPPAGEG